jgi:hypothetical protein
MAEQLQLFELPTVDPHTALTSTPLWHAVWTTTERSELRNKKIGNGFVYKYVVGWPSYSNEGYSRLRMDGIADGNYQEQLEFELTRS